MTGRPPLPWWQRRQPVLVAEAARRAGFHAFVRLGGLLEIVTDGGADQIMDVRFSFRTGAFVVATGNAKDGSRVSFRKNTGPYTSREVVDSIVDWFRADRPSDSTAKLMQDAMIRRSGVLPPTREHEELAPVIPLRRKSS